MRYFRARECRTTSKWPVHGKQYECDHPMYDSCTLYFIDGNQRRVAVTNLFSIKSDYVKLFK